VERNSGPDGNVSDKVVYHVNNNVSVTIRDLAKVGAVLDAAIEAGANSIYGVSFSVAEPEKLEAEARGKAIANALAKAKELAQLNGVEVGAVVSVSDSGWRGRRLFTTAISCVCPPRKRPLAGRGRVS
jgi:uncharacterized protein YggE